ncbi:MAG: VOC family protein [Ardenticatenaceae bacterium]|nr:VOC family protein [Ardenticatenaceae bacterium]
MLITRVDTAIIFTHRMTYLADFYRIAFELDEPFRAPGHTGFQLEDLYLGFDQVDQPRNPFGGVSLWFRVLDLDYTFQRLVNMGALVRYPPVQKPFGERLAAVYDPDGNMIGLSESFD